MARIVYQWTPEIDEMIVRLVERERKTYQHVADLLGIHKGSIGHRLRVLRGREPQEEPPPRREARQPPHLTTYHRVRRGFHVPPELEADYHRLIAGGASIASVREQLGLQQE